MILSHARLPIPTLPPKATLDTNSSPEKANQWLTPDRLTPELLSAFLGSRRDGIKHTITFYHNCLRRFVGYPLTPERINEFLHSLDCGNAKHSYFRAIRAFCNWATREGYLKENPIKKVEAPKRSKRILPSLTNEQVQYLIEQSSNLRDKAIISLLADFDMRLNESANIKASDIDWESYTITIVGKGNKQRKAPFTEQTAKLLQLYLGDNHHSGNILESQS